VPLVYLRFFKTELRSELLHLLLGPDRVFVEFHIQQMRLFLVLLERRLHFFFEVYITFAVFGFLRSPIGFRSSESFTLDSYRGVDGVGRRLI
jgi:hypothetical protein